MRTIEVDESQFRNNEVLRQTVARMLTNPQARKLVQQAQKIIDPNVVIPEIDAAAPIQAELAAVRQQTAADIAAMRQQMEQERVQRENEAIRARLDNQWLQGRNSLVEQGVLPEAITEIEKIMVDKGIVDHDIAAAYYQKMNPPVTPIASGGFAGFGAAMPEASDNDAIKELWETRGESDRALDKLITASISDQRRPAIAGMRR
jgi:thiamine pyrophosphate-dependent acetolactate synthase large subunit-like protein